MKFSCAYDLCRGFGVFDIHRRGAPLVGENVLEVIDGFQTAPVGYTKSEG